MARGRAQLSEKEERIMVQAQLMGLDTASMIRIGNRLRAIDEERRKRQEIDEAIAGYTWEKNPDETCKSTHWRITDRNGKVYTFIDSGKSENGWEYRRTKWNVLINKPGTRFTPRKLDGVSISVYEDAPKRMMPANSRELYGMIRSINRGNFEYA